MLRFTRLLLAPTRGTQPPRARAQYPTWHAGAPSPKSPRVSWQLTFSSCSMTCGARSAKPPPPAAQARPPPDTTVHTRPTATLGMVAITPPRDILAARGTEERAGRRGHSHPRASSPISGASTQSFAAFSSKTHRRHFSFSSTLCMRMSTHPTQNP